MNNDAQQINVIKSSSGGGFRMPKMNPLVVVLTTIVLAIVTAVSVFLLYQNRKTPVAPTAPIPSHASTTQTISDNFSAATLDTARWEVVLEGVNVGQTVSINQQHLRLEIPATTGTSHIKIVTKDQISGDFQAEIDVVGVSGTLSSAARIGFKEGSTLSFMDTTQIKKLKITRVGTIIQAFTDSGSGYVLERTYQSPNMGDGTIEIQLTSINTSAAEWVDLDNFTAQVNLAAAQPTPIPGTAAACAVTFTVLDTVATPTLGPSATPSPTPPPGATPTPTPTPGPTSTPTPAPTPASCNNTCSANADCSSGLICSAGQCRNQSCVSSSSCNCVVATPTSTTPVISSVTPTPVTLQPAGSASAWVLGIGGAIILGLGAILIFAI